MNVDPLPLYLKHHKNISKCFCPEIIKVAVNYYIIDPKSKTLVSFGSSRPCGINYHKKSRPRVPTTMRAIKNKNSQPR